MGWKSVAGVLGVVLLCCSGSTARAGIIFTPNDSPPADTVWTFYGGAYSILDFQLPEHTISASLFALPVPDPDHPALWDFGYMVATTDWSAAVTGGTTSPITWEDGVRGWQFDTTLPNEYLGEVVFNVYPQDPNERWEFGVASVQAAPEPSTLVAMLGLFGTVGVGTWIKRRKK